MRLSLRSLMVGIFVICGLLGWVVGEMREARVRGEVVAEIRAARFIVLYDWQLDERPPTKPPRPWPRWLVDRVGIELLSQPTLVDLSTPIGNVSGRIESGKVDAAQMARLGVLQRLEYLDLGNNPRVTDADLVHLRRMTRLRELHLSRNAIAGPGLAHLEALPSLETLNLSRMPSLTSLAPIARIRSLRTLKLIGLRDDLRLSGLSGGNLESLFLDGAFVDDSRLAEIARISTLEELTLRRCNVSEAGLLCLRGLRNLRTLRIIGTPITLSGVRTLKASLPDTRIIRD